jgi:2-haloacid dehalogenase
MGEERRLPRYELLLIDADDTLFDFRACEEAALRAALGESGIAWSERALREYALANREAWTGFERGLLTHEELKLRRFEDFFARMGIQGDAREVGARYVARLSEERILMPGAEAVLRLLAPLHTLALVTNGIKEVQRGRLRGSPIARYFAATIISEEVGFAKPDPRMLDAAARAAGFSDKSRMVMVGDSLSSDVLAGLNYGIDTVWLNRNGADCGETRPTYEIRDLRELPAILA